MKKQKYKYNSVFKEDIENLIFDKSQYLRSSTIDRYNEFLKLFDLWCIKNNVDKADLSKSLIEKWMQKRDTENSMTRAYRASITRELARNMIKNGKSAYIIPDKVYKGINEHIPYIFNNEEILNLINYFENIKNDPQFCYRKETYCLIFKLLIFTGARKNEILNLKVKDINFEKGIISIIQGKEYIDRDIPITNELLDELNKYKDLLNIYGDDNIYNKQRNKVTKYALKYIFSQALKSCNIEYKGISKGPRIHDFRYTFTTKCIEKLIKEGKDLNVYLPILSKYLGHYSFTETLYYFKPINSLFEEINYKNNTLIPKLERSNFYDE